MKLKVGIFFFHIFLCACTMQEKLMNHNRSYTYMSGSEKITHRVLTDGKNLKVLIKTVPNDILTHYTVLLEVKENYKSHEVLYRDSIAKPILQHNVKEINIPGEYRNKILVLRLIHNTGKYSYLYDIPLRRNAQSAFHMFRNHEPMPENYARANDTLAIKGTAEKDSVFYLFHYSNKFKSAEPPIWANRSIKKNLSIDTMLTVKADTPFLLPQPGMYFIQKDTNSLEGRSIYVSPNRYPAVTKPDELLAPLAYIMSPMEFEELSHYEDTKKAVELFWLTTGGSKEHTKMLIKKFYHQVENANILFTTHKEGWKTDKGMIYILFGVPEEVFRYGQYEEWFYYDDFNSTGISFTFVKKESIFSSNHYELIRKGSYRTYWQKTLEKWRNGILVR
ncbi:GWxTD domain-containing protein [Cytophagaceae bacterium ABcell3]|nr:GWxTD domain-containing protein [Cytophagaceae bacterium ABcell3]